MYRYEQIKNAGEEAKYEQCRTHQVYIEFGQLEMETTLHARPLTHHTPHHTLHPPSQIPPAQGPGSYF